MTKQGMTVAVLAATLAACTPANDGADTAAMGDTMAAPAMGDTMGAPTMGNTGMAAGQAPVQVTMIDTTGANIGTAQLTQEGDSIRVVVQVTGLTDGEHGIHFHENGVCDPPGFTTAGDHFAPQGREHGLENPAGPHAGDLPNLTVTNGRADANFTTPRVALDRGTNSLLKPGGTALVIHADRDDQRTSPSGNSGARIACGVIQQGG